MNNEYLVSDLLEIGKADELILDGKVNTPLIDEAPDFREDLEDE